MATVIFHCAVIVLGSNVLGSIIMGSIVLGSIIMGSIVLGSISEFHVHFVGIS